MFPALLGLISPLIKPILDKIPNPGERDKVRMEFEAQMKQQETEFLKVLQASDQSQTDINKEEAKSSSLFVAGARPFIMWTCGIAYAWTFVFQPMLSFTFNAFGHPVTLPSLDFSELSSVMLGMLGLSGMRTYEKLKGVERNKL